MDHFVFFDTSQYVRHGWMDRDRILKPTDGWQYIKVPVKKHPRNTAINQILIQHSTDWKSRIFGQIGHYKKNAKNYKVILELLTNILALETDSLVDLNIHSIRQIMKYLDLPFSYSVFSDMKLDIPKPSYPDEWALYISKAMEANCYINPIGGRSFFDISKFEKIGIDLFFIEPKPLIYFQKSDIFEPNLSILDVLMYNNIETVREMMDACILSNPNKKRIHSLEHHS